MYSKIKETGIIMSGNHPKLILDGIKTQTRRVIKPQPKACRHKEVFGENDSQGDKPPDWRGQRIDWIGYKHEGRDGWFCYVCGNGLKHIDEFSAHGIICPYGQVGDRLGVKETHWRYGRWERNGFTKTGKQAWKFKATTDECLFFDDEPRKLYPNFSRQHLANLKYSDWFKRPSIFLPKKYIRIWLEITEVRVERVQEITKMDAKAEGSHFAPNYLDAFRELWDSLNAKRGYGWEVNPRVWVISFKLVNISTTNV